MTTSPFNPLGPAHHVPKYQVSLPGLPATRVGVFYATREGHTEHIAQHVAGYLRKLGFEVDAICVRKPIPVALGNYSAAVLAASVHGGHHEKEMIEFVKEHRSELDRMTTAFLSVTLSEAGAERRDTSAAEHARFADDVDKMLGNFFSETNWLPTFTRPVAGALLYSRYGFLVRFVMKRIARQAGGDTDTSHDYIYTDWVGLDRFADELAVHFRAAVHAAPVPVALK